MPFPFAIPWYGIYTEAVDALWLSRVILAHAAELTEAVRALEEVRRAEEPPELLRFEDVLADAPAAADGTVACDNGLVDSSAPLPDLLASGARCVFGVPSLRPRQEEAVTRILFEPGTGGKLLLVERTGGGKSLVLATVAVTAAGVAVVVVPLLLLQHPPGVGYRRPLIGAPPATFGAAPATVGRRAAPLHSSSFPRSCSFARVLLLSHRAVSRGRSALATSRRRCGRRASSRRHRGRRVSFRHTTRRPGDRQQCRSVDSIDSSILSTCRRSRCHHAGRGTVVGLFVPSPVVVRMPAAATSAGRPGGQRDR